jgi:hypothetical protein
LHLKNQLNWSTMDQKIRFALSKETLGQIRGKFGGNVPIPGDNVTLNASDLLSQASAEQTSIARRAQQAT